MVVGIFAPTFQWIVFFGSICSASVLTRTQETLCNPSRYQERTVDQRLTEITDSWQSTSTHPPDSYEMCEPIAEFFKNTPNNHLRNLAKNGILATNLYSWSPDILSFHQGAWKLVAPIVVAKSPAGYGSLVPVWSWAKIWRWKVMVNQ